MSYVRRDESLSILRSQWLVTILDPGEFRQANISLTSGWLIHRLHPHHHHTRFYQSVGASDVCDVQKWNPFPISRISSSGLWLSWRFPQFLSFSDLFPLSRDPGETRLTRPSPSTWRFELSSVLRAFTFLFVAIHKPPICSFFFDIQKFGHIFYFLQRRSLTYIVVIGFQQCLIHRTQRCSLRLFSGNAMNISEMVVKKHFPVVHASTDFTQERRGVSLSLHLPMSA